MGEKVKGLKVIHPVEQKIDKNYFSNRNDNLWKSKSENYDIINKTLVS